MPDQRRPRDKRWILITLLALVAGWAARSVWPSSAAVSRKAAASSVSTAEPPHGVGCIGHFVPEDGIVRVAAPYYQSRPSVVARLAVHAGQQVKSGQWIADLDGKAQLQSELERVRAQLEQARRRLTQTQAGAKASDVEAQRAELARLEASYQLADSQFQRSESLFSAKNISAADFEASRSTRETSRIAVDEAKYRLASLSEVRESDVRVAESDVAVSEAQLKETETQLAGLTVHAPIDGLIVKVNAHQGEQVGPEGIVELADVDKMAVEAEVYASDLPNVHIGQPASVQMEESRAEKSGTVIWIGSEVRQAEVLPNDPTAYSDAHVVPVKIRIPDCANGSCPIHARVKVVIGPTR